MPKKSGIILTVAASYLSLLTPLSFDGCGRAVDEEAVYRETYLSVCDDLDAAASDMEVVVYGAGNARREYRVGQPRFLKLYPEDVVDKRSR
jgi:hypothetical protein